MAGQVTEDMSRQARHGWCELQRFMLRVLDRYPHRSGLYLVFSTYHIFSSQCRLHTAGESLAVDGRVFVWDGAAGKVEEQVTVTIPVQGEIITSQSAGNRAPSKIQIDDIALK